MHFDAIFEANSIKMQLYQFEDTPKILRLLEFHNVVEGSFCSNPETRFYIAFVFDPLLIILRSACKWFTVCNPE